MKNKLHRTDSSDEEGSLSRVVKKKPLTTTTATTTTTTTTTTMTTTASTVLSNLRKTGMHRIVESPVVNPTKIQALLEQLDLYSIDQPKTPNKLHKSHSSMFVDSLQQFSSDRLFDPGKSLVDQIIYHNSSPPIDQDVNDYSKNLISSIMIFFNPKIRIFKMKPGTEPITQRVVSKIDNLLGINVNSKQNQDDQQQPNRSAFKIQLGSKKPVTTTNNNNSNKPTTCEAVISPLYRHLAALGSKLVPMDAFEHLRSHHETSKTVKLELVYGENEYWPVKIKKCQHPGLYQLKKLTHADNNNNNNSSNSLSSSTVVIADSSLNLSMSETNKPGNNNKNMWFFDGSRGVKNLKPLGWSRENNRQAKRPPDDVDLAGLLQPGVDPDGSSNCLESVMRDKIFEENASCEIFDDTANEFVGCKVKRNVNGRLLLEFTKTGLANWMFFTDPRLKFNSDNNDNLASKNLCKYIQI